MLLQSIVNDAVFKSQDTSVPVMTYSLLHASILKDFEYTLLVIFPQNYVFYGKFVR